MELCTNFFKKIPKLQINLEKLLSTYQLGYLNVFLIWNTKLVLSFSEMWKYTSCTSNTGCANILHHMFVKLCSMFVYHNNMANIVNKP